MKKIDYKLPLNIDMNDMCHCCSETCITECGRKQKSNEKLCTISDLSPVCKSYKRNKE